MKYRDRRGNEWVTDTNQDRLLFSLYNNKIGRAVLQVLAAPYISKIAAVFLDSKISSFFIDPFIRKNKILMKEYVPRKYRSYNDFFTRKIKKKYRPMSQSPRKLIAPCDGKVSAYPIKKGLRVQIKNSSYTIGELLQNKKLAREYEDGTMVILRLSVDNYHRYCYVDDGYKYKNHFVKGQLFTVHPVILNHVPIYKRNSRSYCVIATKNFGKLIQMEVGALMVGRICNYHNTGEVRRGQEKGRFAFGGSTVILLTKKDKVRIDEDFLRNTREGFETIVKMGEVIGCKQ